MVKKTAFIEVTVVMSEIESLLLEANLIKKHTPVYNIRLTDGKAYPLIRITKDPFPRILVARKPDDKKSLYFGPYPNVSAMHMVLKTLRRIFPFESGAHRKKICFYNHLGLCPCASVINTPNAKESYKKTVSRIVKFLDGNISTVAHELEKERNQYSKKEDYENAQSVQKQLSAIHLITHPIHAPFEYEVNPNLATDIREKEQRQLRDVLGKKGILINSLKRIECYDISNISGQNATGSMVVFTNGVKDTSGYRRFKISSKIIGPNDFAMMYHVLSRRLNHSEWPLPNLIIIDGGKGQITSALQALSDAGVSVPLIGLAKKEEIIITSDFQIIRLPKRSEALQLVMRIRDEAHRFAITYHKKLRSQFTS